MSYPSVYPMKCAICLILLACWVWPVMSQAQQSAEVFIAAETELVASVETYAFRTSAAQQRALALAKQLRCPQCQNQNLLESNSPVAKELRLKVYQMVDQGQTDQQVIQYMTSRFGDFAWYKPKLSPGTYLLWGAPCILLLLFGSLAYLSIYRQRPR
ncbi:cytochrome c-type biogenesis protein CcmH [Photobacterium atrarenae]|uniref:Cytochrome c-type biogenesis protein n=1 Tax=Photobacterium atrarenae TaxID=865757 RepID=A0ABY5GD24_9GAMM|nr:cytochrome c-type biogenesis protein CcmH [Photobacterium atrarenae]UTV26695.1 cytochrome c-type biogenesis protein CcmH [Photobacterium atrarenae]